MAIGNILLIDIRRYLESEKTYVCSFGLQKNQHPFIKLLIENQNIWLEVHNQMEIFFHHFDKKL